MRLVALGDSVVWGQGLRLDEKFASLFYEEQTGRAWIDDTGPDLPDLHARSGAIIGQTNGSDPVNTTIAGIADKITRHEVPSNTPTVFQQLKTLMSPVHASARKADFVIINGGANDFGISSRVLSANIFSKEFGKRDEVLAEFTSIFTTRARKMLDKAVQVFPDATIALMGYYPIVSHDSIMSRMPAAFVMQWIAAGLGPLPFAGLQAYFKRVKRQAIFFYRTQLRLLRRIATETAADTGRRILFVHPRFSSRNAIGAWLRPEDQFVFEPNTPNDQAAWIAGLSQAVNDGDEMLYVSLVTNLEPQPANHPVSVARRVGCDRAYPGHLIHGDPVDNLTCRIAPVGHPTPHGAAQYARSLKRVADRGSEVSLRSTLTPLAPTGRRGGTLSTRTLLERFNLPVDKGVWFCSQLTDIDAIEIVTVTADRSDAGTDGIISLNVGGPQSWRLNEDILQHDWHNDFRRGATDFFTVDPALDGETLHLGQVRRLQLAIRANFDFLGPWRPAHVTIRINGWPVFQGQVRQMVAPNRPWTVPNYPRPLTPA